jgi:hypothetical protein
VLCTGSIWLRIGTSGGLLWTRRWTFGFHKMLGSSWVAAQLAASQDGLSSMKLVTAWDCVTWKLGADEAQPSTWCPSLAHPSAPRGSRFSPRRTGRSWTTPVRPITLRSGWGPVAALCTCDRLQHSQQMKQQFVIKIQWTHVYTKQYRPK